MGRTAKRGAACGSFERLCSACRSVGSGVDYWFSAARSRRSDVAAPTIYCHHGCHQNLDLGTSSVCCTQAGGHLFSLSLGSSQRADSDLWDITANQTSGSVVQRCFLNRHQRHFRTGFIRRRAPINSSTISRHISPSAVFQRCVCGSRAQISRVLALSISVLHRDD
jgi:hypothetical protein